MGKVTLSAAIGGLTLLLFASGARAQDADGDGVPDTADGAPCDASADGVAFAPAEGVRATVAFEDLWPSRGDLDFNDLVLGVHYTFRLRGAQVTSVRARVSVRAVGSLYDNGFGLHLPVPRGDVASVVRTVDGAPLELPLRPDAELTVSVTDNARELFAGRAGPINSEGAGVAAPEVDVEIRFVRPVDLDLAQAPFDLFLFRTGDAGHEIHPSGYAGTQAMDSALFGTADDGSAGGRFFVDDAGMPFVLTLPDDAAYPREAVAISALYPRILGFAASGGAQDQDFYVEAVASAAYDGAPASNALPPGVDYRCLVGQTAEAAGRTCQAIRDRIGSQAPSAAYWIDPDGPGWGHDPFRVFCDMQTEGRGWEVLHYDEMRHARQPRGVPSAAPGWSVDYTSPGSPLRDARIGAFRFEVDQGPSRTFSDVRAYASGALLTVFDVFGTGDTGSWACNSDSPTSSCDFTDGAGRHWGIWAHDSACCLGGDLGGYWYHSETAAGGENYGICGGGYPNGAAYAPGTTGCSGSGHFTPTAPNGSGTMRLLVQLWAPVAEGRTCRTILDDGDSRGDDVYLIDPDGPHGAEPIEVFCDMSTDGGGWTVLHDDALLHARQPRGRPAAGPGWSVDYLSAQSSLSSLHIEDFRFELPGVSSRVFSGVRAYGSGRPLTPPDLLSGAHRQGWQCNSDSPNANCWFTTDDGRHWGLWDSNQSCCIGASLGGFWFYSQSTQGTENWGVCGDGYPLGAAYTGNQSGCDGGGYYTPVQPTGGQRLRLAVREAARPAALNAPEQALATCRALLDAGASRGDGVYYTDGRTGRPERTYCDMTTDGGGWTAFFAGRNGQPNAFDAFDASAHRGVCYDAGDRCLRRMPSSVPEAGTEIAISHGPRVVAFDVTPATYAYFTAGAQAGWQRVPGRALTPTEVGFDTFWTGAGSNTGWIAAGNETASRGFASSYARSASWSVGNGQSDTSTPIRILFREGGRPPRPMLNAESAARASCRVILDRGESQGTGLYWLAQGGAPFPAWCDMTLDGGGWTAFVVGHNGQASTFDHMEAGYHSGVCTDPATRCFSRMPSGVPVANTEIAVTTQDQAVAFALTPAVHAWATQGTQAGWQPIQSLALTGDVRTLPTQMWTGSGANTSWIVARGNTQSQTFASMYDYNSSWDYSNGRYDASSPVRLMYREGGIPQDPSAFASCAAARAAGGTADGVYRIQRPGHRVIDVFCNQSVDGGGWQALFAGTNGQPNVFDHFDSAYHAGVCTDPGSRCLRYLPADVDVSRLEMAVACGDAMVAFTPGASVTQYFTAGASQGWRSVSGARAVGAAPVAQLPNTVWTGSGTNRGFIFARDQDSARTFGASYRENGGWNGCNGVGDTTSPLYVFWRE